MGDRLRVARLSLQPKVNKVKASPGSRGKVRRKKGILLGRIAKGPKIGRLGKGSKGRWKMEQVVRMKG